ncbi:F-box protein [Carex littledalei]|uniref:F-box protein n=1 Tax=Carex littledalei TaxID=544730 RepID=A0A833QQR1_9POAL|nr:F-box protein [Carex littledalei]
MTCWSDLTSDVLERITSFMPLGDYHRFSAVCKNWRLVANEKRYSPTPQLPWLVLGDEPGTRKRIFYNLSEDKHYAMDIPELYSRYICGSSHGWLVAIDINITGILINPFTREFYELPLFPQYDIGMFDTTPFKNVPTDYRNGYRGNTLDRLRVSVVHKAILSHDPKKRPDFTVMHDLDRFEGCTCFLEARRFILESIGVLKQSYLVNCFGYLLFVVWWHQPNEEGHFRTKYFEVIRPDFEKGEAYGLDTFDDHALFLGTNDSIFVDLSEVPGCNGKTDSIYFTDAAWRSSHEKFKFGWDDMGIFNMSNKTLETFYSHEIHHTRVGSPIWLTPNPW